MFALEGSSPSSCIFSFLKADLREYCALGSNLPNHCFIFGAILKNTLLFIDLVVV